MSRALGAAGEQLIKSFEKMALKSYKDEGGKWTIGWGHTGLFVGSNQTCTPEQAEQWFLEDTAHTVKEVNESVVTAKTVVTQNQFDALVAFGYNIGDTAERYSTLIKKLVAGDVTGAATEFPKWTKVKGVTSLGLVRRRAAEQALFQTPSPA